MSESLPISKQYLISSLKDFDAKILSKKYSEGSVSGITQISKEENNAIIEKKDGIFVDDKAETITEIQNRIAGVTKYQRYVNTELDSCFCTLTQKYYTVKDDLLPFVISSGNMEVIDGKVKIKPGQRVQMHIHMSYNTNSTAANVRYAFIDTTNNIELSALYPFRGQLTDEYGYSQTCQYTNETDDDCWIGVKVTITNSADTLAPGYTTLSVQEIGRKIVIDPLEYANTSKGLEDTPVGHIITYMGNNPPKHYLSCDGTEYNIADYPHLAEQIKEEFGEYNYFGGNGETTFAVPDLRGEFLRGTGTNGHVNSGNGADVGEHQEGSRVPVGYFGNESGRIYVGGGNWTTGDKFDKWVGNTGTAYRHDPHATDGYPYSSVVGSGVMRPTNTSVLYCIKYEPTYFIQIGGQGGFKIQTDSLMFDSEAVAFNLPVDDMMYNVYINGLYMTEGIDYKIDRNVSPNQIIFEEVYDDFDVCTLTYLT